MQDTVHDVSFEEKGETDASLAKQAAASKKQAALPPWQKCLPIKF